MSDLWDAYWQADVRYQAEPTPANLKAPQAALEAANAAAISRAKKTWLTPPKRTSVSPPGPRAGDTTTPTRGTTQQTNRQQQLTVTGTDASALALVAELAQRLGLTITPNQATLEAQAWR